MGFFRTVNELWVNPYVVCGVETATCFGFLGGMTVYQSLYGFVFQTLEFVMSKKIQLPDEILDGIAGGVFTIGGQTVSDLSITDEGMSITCAGQTFKHTWSEKERKELKDNPTEFSMFKDAMAQIQGSSSSCDLEDALKMLGLDM
ncbi:hypothetical protein JCM12178A_11450 [Salidesulfovibrio brasiliensis]